MMFTILALIRMTKVNYSLFYSATRAVSTNEEETIRVVFIIKKPF